MKRFGSDGIWSTEAKSRFRLIFPRYFFFPFLLFHIDLKMIPFLASFLFHSVAIDSYPRCHAVDLSPGINSSERERERDLPVLADSPISAINIVTYCYFCLFYQVLENSSSHQQFQSVCVPFITNSKIIIGIIITIILRADAKNRCCSKHLLSSFLSSSSFLFIYLWKELWMRYECR